MRYRVTVKMEWTYDSDETAREMHRALLSLISDEETNDVWGSPEHVEAWTEKI